MNLAYVRVSTVEQNEERQIAALEPHGIDKWFTEKVSAKDMNRPQLQALIEFAREGDSIYIHDLTRIARNTEDLLRIVRTLQEKQVNLNSNKEMIDTNTPTGKLMLTMMAAIAEFERENLLERQREGIELAKYRGAYKGRKKIKVEELPQFDELYLEYMSRKINKIEFAKKLGVSRSTLFRTLKKKQDKSKFNSN